MFGSNSENRALCADFRKLLVEILNNIVTGIRNQVPEMPNEEFSLNVKVSKDLIGGSADTTYNIANPIERREYAEVLLPIILGTFYTGKPDNLVTSVKDPEYTNAAKLMQMKFSHLVQRYKCEWEVNAKPASEVNVRYSNLVLEGMSDVLYCIATETYITTDVISAAAETLSEVYEEFDRTTGKIKGIEISVLDGYNHFYSGFCNNGDVSEDARAELRFYVMNTYLHQLHKRSVNLREKLTVAKRQKDYLVSVEDFLLKNGLCTVDGISYLTPSTDALNYLADTVLGVPELEKAKLISKAQFIDMMILSSYNQYASKNDFFKSLFTGDGQPAAALVAAYAFTAHYVFKYAKAIRLNLMRGAYNIAYGVFDSINNDDVFHRNVLEDIRKEVERRVIDFTCRFNLQSQELLDKQAEERGNKQPEEALAGARRPQLSTLSEEKPEETGNSRVDHPSYYNLKNGPFLIHNGEIIPIECIDVIRNMPTWKGNVIKYLWRCGEKEEAGLSIEAKELEDMEKGAWYLLDKIKEIKAKLNNLRNTKQAE